MVNSKNDQLIESFDPVYSIFRLVTKKFLRFWHDPQAAHWGAGDQFFLPWAKDSIWKRARLNLPTLLGLSALFDQEIAEFTNRSEYQK